MKEEGRITKIEENYAYVLIKRHSACGKCKACELGAGDRTEIEIKSRNKLDAKVDDQVVVELESPDVLKAAFIVYMIPLMAFAVGWFVSWVIGVKNEMINLLVSFVLMCCAFIIVRSIDNKMEKTKKYESKIIEISGN